MQFSRKLAAELFYFLLYDNNKIDWSVCLLALKHLVSLQARTRPLFQAELDLHTASDKLIEIQKKKKMLYLFP